MNTIATATGLSFASRCTRIEDGLIAEHWESVDWVRVCQSFGLLPDQIKDA